MYQHLIYELLKHLGPLVDSIPDSPRVGRRLLMSGGVLLSALFVPTTSPQWGDLILICQVLCAITGGVCLMIGGFIFFRRWVWRRQEKRTPVVTSLDLK